MRRVAAGLAEDPAALEVAEPLAVLDSAFEVPPETTGYERVHDCLIEEPTEIHMMFGHQHAWGVLFELDHVGPDGAAETLYHATDGLLLRNNPEYKFFDPPLALAAGDKLRIRCRWDNDTAAPLAWPSEMCVAVMYYTPARGFLTCDPSVGKTSPGPLTDPEAVGCAAETDAGNSKGVGEFCTPDGGECDDNDGATACLAAFDARAHYCSKIFCADDAECGEDATCQTNDMGSACVPDKCL